MIDMIILLGAAVIVASGPVVSGVSVSSINAGACALRFVAVEAQIRISWSLTSPDAALYDVLLYENGGLLATLAGTTIQYDKTISGSVEDPSGSYGSHWSSNWVYRVDVVRKSDGVVVSSASAPQWTLQYGDCT